MTYLEIAFTIFIIISNTVIQLVLSKKDIKVFTLVWGRDMISTMMFIHLGVYWQVYILLWQFILTLLGFLCWRHESKTGTPINQIQLIKHSLQKLKWHKKVN